MGEGGGVGGLATNVAEQPPEADENQVGCHHFGVCHGGIEARVAAAQDGGGDEGGDVGQREEEERVGRPGVGQAHVEHGVEGALVAAGGALPPRQPPEGATRHPCHARGINAIVHDRNHRCDGNDRCG